MYVKYEFSALEITEVENALKIEKNLVVKERLQAVYMTMQNLKRREVVKYINRSRFFVGTWIKRYKDDGIEGLQEQRGGDNKSYLTPEQEAFVKDIVVHSFPKDCNYNAVTWSGYLLVDLIENMFGKTYSRDGIYALLKRLNVSYKKANKIDPKKSQKVINEWKLQMEKNSKLQIIKTV
jgi:putative transposase